MQHRDREDEGEVEPVGDENMRLLAAEDRAEEHQKVDDPDDRQPEVGVPLGLRIFLALGDAEQIAGAGDEDEEIVAEDDEPGREIAGQARSAGALYDIERRRQEDVAAEGEDHRRGVQGPQAAEVEPWRDVEVGERELEGDVDADRHARQAPEQGEQGPDLDGREVVIRQSADLERRPFRRTGVEALEDREYARRRRPGSEPHMESVGGLDRLGGDEDA